MANEQLYASLDDVRTYLRQEPGDDQLDAFIASMIGPVSRRIDQHCHRWFYSRTQTRYFDYQAPDRLWLDADLLTVTTLTNGDGEVFSASDYFLMPNNASHFRFIDINQEVGRYFTWSGRKQRAITVAGTWGYSTTAPEEIMMGVVTWIAILTSVSENPNIRSKSIGSFSVSYGSVGEALKSTPSEVKSWIDPFVRRDYRSARFMKSKL